MNRIFISTSYLGELVSRKNGKIALRNVCVVYEVPVPDNKGGLNIMNQFYTHSQYTNGQWILREDDVMAEREVESGDELLTGYDASMTAYRLQKSGIKPAASINSASDIGRA
ncbi:MAG: hypothetical protein HC883_02975 [Bdellovibrionaceae bacterium]|nr:hypothetical protein [Pseudobdellovibrionaceae bacterium]